MIPELEPDGLEAYLRGPKCFFLYDAKITTTEKHQQPENKSPLTITCISGLD